MINCAYIGFGKSATRYHLPYVLCRKDKYNVKRIYDIARKPEIEAQPHYQHICFTSRLQDILEDNTLQLVVICTHPDSHFEYARLCLAHGKTCWSRNLLQPPRRSENAVCSGERRA